MKSGIYKITSPSSKVYIGQSVNIQVRFSRYKRLSCKRQVALYNSFLKYGAENHLFDVIERCEIDHLNIRERYWQDHYDVLGFNGLNCCLTKTEEKRYVLSEESRLKISNSASGENHYMYGKSMPEEIKTKISEKLKGKNSVHYGKNKKPESIKKTIQTKIEKYGNGSGTIKYKKIIHAETGIVFKSMKDASLYFNVNPSFISMCISGRRGNSLGLFLYEYFENNKDKCLNEIELYKLKNRKDSQNSNAKKVTDISTGRNFGCIKDYAKYIGKSINSIYQNIHTGKYDGVLIIGGR